MLHLLHVVAIASALGEPALSAALHSRALGKAIEDSSIGETPEGETHMKISQSIRELIAKAPLAHLTTINSKGGPQVTAVWVGIEDEEFVIGHLAVHQKVKNIRRDPRVALSMW